MLVLCSAECLSKWKANCVGCGQGNGVAKMVLMVWTRSRGGGGPIGHSDTAGVEARSEGGSIGLLLVSSVEGKGWWDKEILSPAFFGANGLSRGLFGGCSGWKVLVWALGCSSLFGGWSGCLMKRHRGLSLSYR